MIEEQTKLKSENAEAYLGEVQYDTNVSLTGEKDFEKLNENIEKNLEENNRR